MASPHLFLIDISLPRIDGLEVLGCLRRSVRCASIPVVIMTSSDSHSDRVNAGTLGATVFFRKPAGYEAFLTLGAIIKEQFG